MTRPEPVGIQVAAAPAAPAAAADDSCENLLKLEPPAMMGKLSVGQTQCLESSYSAAAKQTDKDDISRLLMTNAYSKGDKRTWEKLVKRHLDEVDQSDPNICYKYASYLAKKGLVVRSLSFIGRRLRWRTARLGRVVRTCHGCTRSTNSALSPGNRCGRRPKRILSRHREMKQKRGSKVLGT